MHLNKSGKVGLRGAALAGAVAVAALGAGTTSAMASVCPAGTIGGQGSSLQKTAQGIWGPAYVAQCAVPKPTVNTYSSTNSGSALAAFGGYGAAFSTANVFVASDEAPRSTNSPTGSPLLSNMSSAITTLAGTSGSAVTVPVVQAAIAVIVHLPASCTLTGGFISNTDLEAIYHGDYTNWGQLGNDSGTGCATAPVENVVRPDESGTTYQFKRYLSQIATSNGQTARATDWLNRQTGGSPVGTNNKSWPGTSTAAAATGGGGVVAQVANDAGSIGYVALSDAETAAVPAGKVRPTILQVQNDGTGSVSTHGSPVATGSNSNCDNATYAVAGTSSTLPSNGDWSNVVGSDPDIADVTSNPADYPLCVLTFDLGVTHTAGIAASVFGTTVQDTALNYLEYVVSTPGQTAIAGQWYDDLTPAVKTAAQTAATLL